MPSGGERDNFWHDPNWPAGITRHRSDLDKGCLLSGIGFVVLWVLCLLLGAGFVGVCTWAIIVLVHHFAK